MLLNVFYSTKFPPSDLQEMPGSYSQPRSPPHSSRNRETVNVASSSRPIITDSDLASSWIYSSKKAAAVAAAGSLKPQTQEPPKFQCSGTSSDVEPTLQYSPVRIADRGRHPCWKRTDWVSTIITFSAIGIILSIVGIAFLEMRSNPRRPVNITESSYDYTCCDMDIFFERSVQIRDSNDTSFEDSDSVDTSADTNFTTALSTFTSFEAQNSAESDENNSTTTETIINCAETADSTEICYVGPLVNNTSQNVISNGTFNASLDSYVDVIDSSDSDNISASLNDSVIEALDVQESEDIDAGNETLPISQPVPLKESIVEAMKRFQSLEFVNVPSSRVKTNGKVPKVNVEPIVENEQEEKQKYLDRLRVMMFDNSD